MRTRFRSLALCSCIAFSLLHVTSNAQTSSVSDVMFLSDGRLAAAAGNSVLLWRISDWSRVGTLRGDSGWVNAIGASPDASLIASAGGGAGKLRLYGGLGDDAIAKTLMGAELRFAETWSVAFNPTGQLLASGSGATAGSPGYTGTNIGGYVYPSDFVVRLWRVSDGSLLQELRGHKEPIGAVQFSPDGKLLASASSRMYLSKALISRGGADNSIRLWNIENPRAESVQTPVLVLPGNEDGTKAVAFSVDSRFLASGGADDRVKLWQVATGDLVRESDSLEGHRSPVTAIAFSPDGALLASAGLDGDIVLWRWNVPGRSMVFVRRFKDVANSSATSVAFDRDGILVAAGHRDGKVRVWRAASGELIKILSVSE